MMSPANTVPPSIIARTGVCLTTPVTFSPSTNCWKALLAVGRFGSAGEVCAGAGFGAGAGEGLVTGSETAGALPAAALPGPPPVGGTTGAHPASAMSQELDPATVASSPIATTLGAATGGSLTRCVIGRSGGVSTLDTTGASTVETPSHVKTRPSTPLRCPQKAPTKSKHASPAPIASRRPNIGFLVRRMLFFRGYFTLEFGIGGNFGNGGIGEANGGAELPSLGRGKSGDRVDISRFAPDIAPGGATAAPDVRIASRRFGAPPPASDSAPPGPLTALPAFSAPLSGLGPRDTGAAEPAPAFASTPGTAPRDPPRIRSTGDLEPEANGDPEFAARVG